MLKISHTLILAVLLLSLSACNMGAGSSGAGNGSAATQDDKGIVNTAGAGSGTTTEAQPSPLGGGVFSTGPVPEGICSMNVSAGSSVQCLQAKTGFANVILQGTLAQSESCGKSEKGYVLRAVNGTPAGSTFADIWVNTGGSFYAILMAQMPAVWSFYEIDPEKNTTFLSPGDPKTVVVKMAACKADTCTVGEGRAPLESTVKPEEPQAPPPDCAPKSKETTVPPEPEIYFVE